MERLVFVAGATAVVAKKRKPWKELTAIANYFWGWSREGQPKTYYWKQHKNDGYELLLAPLGSKKRMWLVSLSATVIYLRLWALSRALVTTVFCS